MSHYKEDAVEFMRYADEIDEAGNAAVDVTPTLPNSPDEVDPNPRKKRRRGPSVVVPTPTS
jgi:hypothetical protein